MKNPLSIAWFSSARDEESSLLLEAVLKEIRRGTLNAKISLVFCNRHPREGQEVRKLRDLAGKHKLPFVILSSEIFSGANGQHPLPSQERRRDYEREVIEVLDEAGFNFDLCLLAGYTLYVGEEMCQRYKMINLRPALPGGPQGSWSEIVRSLIAERAEKTGATIHLVTPELAGGPVMFYYSLSLKGGLFEAHWKEIKESGRAWREEESQIFQEIRRCQLMRNPLLVVSAIKALCEGWVRIEGNRIVGVNGDEFSGCDLAPEIDAVVGVRPQS